MRVEEKIWTFYDDVATTAFACGFLDIAESMFSASLDEAQRVDKNWLRMARSWFGLAMIYHSRAESKEAMHFYRKALYAFDKHADVTKESRESAQLKEADNRLASCCENLAVLYLSHGFLARARHLLRRAVNIYERLFGLEHPILVPSMVRLGYVYSEWNQPDKAITFYLRAKALQRTAKKDSQDL